MPPFQNRNGGIHIRKQNVGAGALDGPNVTNSPEVNQNATFYRWGVEGAAPYSKRENK